MKTSAIAHRVLLSLLATLFAPSALAMRCGNHVISEGDHEARVRHYCGNPQYTNTQKLYKHRGVNAQQKLAPSHTTTNAYNEVVHVIDIEEWTYNFGSNKLIHVVSFANGRVFKIKREGRGH